MDLICVGCRELWDLTHVLHEEPEGFQRKGGVIYQCPCCEERHSKGIEGLDEYKRALLETIRETLGDDIDGFAAELEDLNILEQL